MNDPLRPNVAIAARCHLAVPDQSTDEGAPIIKAFAPAPPFLAHSHPHGDSEGKHLLILSSGGVVRDDLREVGRGALDKIQELQAGEARRSVTMPLVMMARGEDGRLGNRPMGWPLYTTSVCSSLISLR